MSKITELTARLAEPIVAAQGCTLWDVEYVKEAGTYFLRLFIDKPEGVFIDDCETVSRAVSDLLDEADPIAEPYTFEVSSAGADRILKTPAHFAAFPGASVEVRLYKPRDGQKMFVGNLTAYEGGGVTLTDGDGKTQQFEKAEVAQVRLHVEF
jgi:ribosome maturation factor RimP